MEKFQDVSYVIRNYTGQTNALTKMIKMLILSKTVITTQQTMIFLKKLILIILITNDISKSEIFVVEASKSAVIDTAYTKTVAGK